MSVICGGGSFGTNHPALRIISEEIRGAGILKKRAPFYRLDHVSSEFNS